MEMRGFDVALKAVKSQMYVISRAGWNAEGQFVYYVPPAEYKAQTQIAKNTFGWDALVPYAGYFALKNAQGQVAVWVPSTGDLLAEDWVMTNIANIPNVNSPAI